MANPKQVIVDKLQDKALLRNVCEFSALHRAIVAGHLWTSLPDSNQPNELRSVALELAANYVAALEDVVLWFYVLQEWKLGNESLFDLLDNTQVRESVSSNTSSDAALSTITNWTIADMRREFALPSDEFLLANGWDEGGVNRHINALRDALQRLKEGIAFRVEEEGILTTTYNKIKHGNLAVATTEHSHVGISVMLSSRRGPIGPSGKRQINTGWLPCDREELLKVAASTLILIEAMWTLLNLLYVAKFDSEWALPPWPVSGDIFQ